MARDRFKKIYNNINYNMLSQIRFTKKEKEFFNTKINDAEENYQDIQTFTLHITNRCRLKRNDFTILFKMFKKYNISFD